MDIFTLPAIKYPWYDRSSARYFVSGFTSHTITGNQNDLLLTVPAGKKALVRLCSGGPENSGGAATADAVMLVVNMSGSVTLNNAFWYRQSESYSTSSVYPMGAWDVNVVALMSAGETLYMATRVVNPIAQIDFRVVGAYYTFDA